MSHFVYILADSCRGRLSLSSRAVDRAQFVGGRELEELLHESGRSEENGRYYVGRSKTPERRVEHHNTTSTGFTSRYRPWRLVFTQAFATKEKAVEAEQLIKGWKSRKMTRYVVEGKIQLEERIG